MPNEAQVKDTSDPKPQRRAIGLNLGTVAVVDLPLPHRLELAATTGYEGVEILAEDLLGKPDSVVDRCLAQLRALDLRCFGLCPTPEVFRWHHEMDAAVRSSVERHLDLGQRLGCGYLVLPVMAGGAGDLSLLARNFRDVATAAADRGIVVALEGIGHVPTLADYALVASIVAATGSGSARVMFDTFHYFRGGGTVSGLSQQILADVVAVQASDAIDKPLASLVGYDDRTFPSDGIFPLVDCFAVLDHRLPHYTPFVIEIFNSRLASLGAEQIARRALMSLSQLLANAGSGVPHR